MNRSTFIRLALGGAVGASLTSLTPAISRGETTADVTPRAKNRSLQLEIGRSIEKGLAFLKAKQDPAGHWTSADYPALTGLCVTAFLAQPGADAQTPAFLEKALAYIASCAKADGGIYGKELANYNTSVCMLALMAADAEKYGPLIRKGRQFIIGQQNFYPKKEGKMDPYEGGIGYGDDGPHSDVSNTSFALETLHKTKPLIAGHDVAGAKDLDWGAATAFLQRCQNDPQFNKMPWVTGDKKNVGGFIYTPLESHAEDEIDGKKVPRSYGSMSYEGMLSYIYAGLTKDDPRIVSVQKWLSRNYTLKENPALGPEGLFYYYHTLAKCLSTAAVDKLALADGKSVDWRQELALHLIDLQASEGSWVNTKSGRWWEKDPVLVTCYATRALEIIHPEI